MWHLPRNTQNLESHKPVMSFTLTSYNLLASDYIKPRFYPRTSPEILKPEWRIPALVQHIVKLESDVLCFQEVDQKTLTALRVTLEPMGYEGYDARKGGGKPDGCSTFFRFNKFKLKHLARLEYSDGNSLETHSGHVALTLVLEHSGRNLGIANTHLKWDTPGTPLAQRFGYQQITQWLLEHQEIAPEMDAWMVCGDFNVEPENQLISVLQKAGFEYTHRGLDIHTCNSNDRAKMIDFIFHNHALRSVPMLPPEIDNLTPLPSLEQPSDHLALSAQFEWIAPS